MYIISLAIFIFVMLLWAALIFIRKSLWDTVHRNLIDLEVLYSGKIIRNGFAARPVFKGKINKDDLTINFSSARSSSGRKTYMDITLTMSWNLSLTIAEKNWLKEQNGENVSDVHEINIGENLTYVIMPGNNSKIERLINKKEFVETLKRFEHLAYFFIGKSGTIVEFWSNQIDRDTEIDNIKNRIQNIRLLLSVIK